MNLREDLTSVEIEMEMEILKQKTLRCDVVYIRIHVYNRFTGVPDFFFWKN